MIWARRVAFIALVAVLIMSVVGRTDLDRPAFQGWIEANSIFVGPDEAGRVETLHVREGEKVEVNQALFAVDEDLQQADVMLNEASVKNAQQNYFRAQRLLSSAAGTEKTLDDAESALRTSEARLNSARTRLRRRKIISPVAGTVQQVYYRPGEMVPGGRPILALLPPGNLKARFFVPEGLLPRISYGDTVTVNCDGCPSGITATISFIAKTAEFTPPVIYSRNERAKLVFLVEALPNNPEALRVGQPIDVALPLARPGREAARETKQ